ncbi:hypothetical protein DXV75_15810 [Alteromonas aestuariivivens]|uniref:Uncharacterized protein n=1 Tax=Alteromonas aestuariivivens TaxID=1938339 RepID=A0A3D8M310_9ALTE|nr:hypothetical protein [Alteromonas aestuariivivens]RDV24031.1 hypothetical protein DXV75_15810 [Alteromonas aestuariivivens]
MALKDIDNISLFTYFKQPSLALNKPEFPVIAFVLNGQVIAAIKVTMARAWHVENVTAKQGYGPTIYKVLMDLAGSKGIAPSFKYAKERQDYVVHKSRNIWHTFAKSEDVSTSFLDDKYEDQVLNNKFVSINPIKGITQAKRNLRNTIRSQYVNQMGFSQKLKSYLKPKQIDLKYRAFICDSHFNISRAAKTLLEESVKAHR